MLCMVRYIESWWFLSRPESTVLPYWLISPGKKHAEQSYHHDHPRACRSSGHSSREWKKLVFLSIWGKKSILAFDEKCQLPKKAPLASSPNKTLQIDQRCTEIMVNPHCQRPIRRPRQIPKTSTQNSMGICVVMQCEHLHTILCNPIFMSRYRSRCKHTIRQLTHLHIFFGIFNMWCLGYIKLAVNIFIFTRFVCFLLNCHFNTKWVVAGVFSLLIRKILEHQCYLQGYLQDAYIFSTKMDLSLVKKGLSYEVPSVS